MKSRIGTTDNTNGKRHSSLIRAIREIRGSIRFAFLEFEFLRDLRAFAVNRLSGPAERGINREDAKSAKKRPGTRIFRFSAVLSIAPLIAGCAHHHEDEQRQEDLSLLAPAPPKATDVPLEQATPDFWLAKPAKFAVPCADFRKLWDACAGEARDRLFTIDLQDYRTGTLTTRPLVTKQFFEVWRDDTDTVYGLLQSSLQTIRRRIVFQVRHTEDGQFVAEPKVLIERLAQTPARITSVQEYRSGVAARGQFVTDEGQVIPESYWYAIGRDEKLERAIADDVRDRLR